MNQYCVLMILGIVFTATYGCRHIRQIVSVDRCGEIEMLDVRYDPSLGDSLCRVILEGVAPDTSGVLQPIEYWYHTAFDYTSKLFDERTARIQIGKQDTIVIPSLLYSFSFRAGGRRDRAVHSMELPLYHSHEYRLRAYIDPVCEVQWTLP